MYNHLLPGHVPVLLWNNKWLFTWEQNVKK
jgi:hypothetical protein